MENLIETAIDEARELATDEYIAGKVEIAENGFVAIEATVAFVAIVTIALAALYVYAKSKGHGGMVAGEKASSVATATGLVLVSTAFLLIVLIPAAMVSMENLIAWRSYPVECVARGLLESAYDAM